MFTLDVDWDIILLVFMAVKVMQHQPFIISNCLCTKGAKLYIFQSMCVLTLAFAALSTDHKKEIGDAGGQNELTPKGSGLS